MLTEILKVSKVRLSTAALVTAIAGFTLINGFMSSPVQASGGCCGVNDCRILGPTCQGGSFCSGDWDGCCSSGCI